jgi:butyrate kinase
MPLRVLAINPGATSTKIAVFEDDTSVFRNTVPHNVEDLKSFHTLIDQIPYRRELILQNMKNANIALNSFDAVVGRGGILAPLPGGVYEVSDVLSDDARSFRYGEHVANLGPILANEFAVFSECKAYIIDPVSTDEFCPLARMSGIAGVSRESHFHALNHKAVVRKIADEMGRSYQDVTFIVAHLGTGVSVGAHVKGLVVDAHDPMNEGSFSIDRAGGIPALSLIDICYSGQFEQKDMKRHLNGNGGLYSYLGTKDMLEVEKRIKSGDELALFVVEAMAYQITKDIGSMAAVCGGKVDRVILTGGLANYDRLVGLIRSKIEFIAPMALIPGEEEMGAMVDGVLRVLRGLENAKNYSEELEKSGLLKIG